MEIEIDGNKVEVEQGLMIIEAADQYGIAIPRFCYHKKLSVAANCRMCLVEVEKIPKPLPACATPITEGMKIWTNSAATKEAQHSVMEFLLINHPLDCPICDQGGECELQDVALSYGQDNSRFSEGKRVVKDKDIGPLIATDLTRCIHCTRCVRFGDEIAGNRELGATGRGEHMQIGTFIEKNVQSEVSGNVIDLCPVGALTSKPFRYQARAWELSEAASIAPHDCLGSNINIHYKQDMAMRVVPKENNKLNEVWLSDRDRFSYVALNSNKRLLHPKINKNGKLTTVSWDEALSFATENIKETDKWAWLTSPNTTLEEGYLFQKLARSLNCSNIDHRLRQQDFSYQDDDPLFFNIGIDLINLEQQDNVLLIGSNIHKEVPLLGLRLRKLTTAEHGKIYAINPLYCDYNFPVESQIVDKNADMLISLLAIAKALVEQGVEHKELVKWKKLLTVKPKTEHKEIAENLRQGKSSIILGLYVFTHPQRTHIIAITAFIAEILNATLGLITDGANSAGLALVGCLPHRLIGGEQAPENGKNTAQMWDENTENYMLMGFDPLLDTSYPNKALAALKKAKTVIACSAFESPILNDVCDVILPISPFTENEGTFINCTGDWQSFNRVVPSKGESKPAWKLLRVLANNLQLTDFDYNSITEILQEIEKSLKIAITLPKLNSILIKDLPKQIKIASNEFIRLGPIAMYNADYIVRNSIDLQNTKEAAINNKVIMHPNVGKSHKLLAGSYVKIANQINKEPVSLEVLFSDKIPEKCLLIPSAMEKTVSIGAPYEIVYLHSDNAN